VLGEKIDSHNKSRLRLAVHKLCWMAIKLIDDIAKLNDRTLTNQLKVFLEKEFFSRFEQAEQMVGAHNPTDDILRYANKKLKVKWRWVLAPTTFIDEDGTEISFLKHQIVEEVK